MTKKQTGLLIRPYQETDFPEIHAMNKMEGWSNLVEKHEDAKQAWGNSNIAFVAQAGNEIIGSIRGLTDGCITLYISELIIHENYRGKGVGKKLMAHAHERYPKTRMELLASNTSHSYYETQGFRPFYGFRKTMLE